MKDFNKARKIEFNGRETYHWIEWRKDLKKRFVVMYPGSSMNSSSLEKLEKMINDAGHPTLIKEPDWMNSDLNYFSGDLSAVIKKEGIEKPILLGQSAGYPIIIDYICKTNNADKVIGICCSHKFSETAKNKFYFYLFDKILRYSGYFGSAYMDILHKIKKEKRDYRDYSNLEGKKDIPHVWLSIVDVPFNDISEDICNGRKIIKWDITEKLKKIKNNTLLVYGRSDMLVTPKAGEYISKYVKGDCIIKVIEGDHSLPTTRPGEVMKVISEYLI